MRRRTLWHFLIALGVGAIAGVIAWFTTRHSFGPSIAWDATALTFILLKWREVRTLDSDETHAFAADEDSSRVIDELLVLGVDVCDRTAAVATRRTARRTARRATGATATGTATDLFEALAIARRTLESRGILLQCSQLLRCSLIFFQSSGFICNWLGLGHCCVLSCERFAFLSTWLLWQVVIGRIHGLVCIVRWGFRFKVSGYEIVLADQMRMRLRHIHIGGGFKVGVVVMNPRLLRHCKLPEPRIAWIHLGRICPGLTREFAVLHGKRIPRLRARRRFEEHIGIKQNRLHPTSVRQNPRAFWPCA